MVTVILYKNQNKNILISITNRNIFNKTIFLMDPPQVFSEQLYCHCLRLVSLAKLLSDSIVLQMVCLILMCTSDVREFSQVHGMNHPANECYL